MVSTVPTSPSLSHSFLCRFSCIFIPFEDDNNSSSSSTSSPGQPESLKQCKRTPRASFKRERSSSLPRVLTSSGCTAFYPLSDDNHVNYLSTPSASCSLTCSTSNSTSSSYSHLVPRQREAFGSGLCRTKSFRVDKSSNYRIFRACDLVQGKLLGRGFFGEVFLVTHKESGEKMVLKELYRVDEEAQLNFLKEVAFLRSLNHTNIIQFIGVLYKDKKLHLLTEYISGGTLRELIHDLNKPLQWERRLNFAKDISSGMTYLHSMNIIHRDLNSQNCLVKDDGTVVVADFGLARIISSSRRLSDGTTAGKKRDRRKRYTVVGNPYWMAPEMMKGKEYDEKVDLFSFGIILCETIGRVQADPDYMPRNADFGLNKLTFREKYCGSCPEAFWKIAFLCTEIDPDKRPSFRLLERWLQTISTHWRISQSLNIPNELLSEICSFTQGFHRKIVEESSD